ncbi:MAG: hypothetical protein J3K34DRAFT_441456 [Monoraphidium minutum]|nr:MAG: hypothetical protein J3K34DRAFT_441456 [Monoraphidium minutum]
MTHGGQPVLLAALQRYALLLFLSLSCRTHVHRPKSPAILARAGTAAAMTRTVEQLCKAPRWGLARVETCAR